MANCGYVTLPNGRQIHFRAEGSGPPLLVLHPSPQHSGAMGAALNAFSPLCTCIAMDTPGYGWSDAVALETPTVSDYAIVLNDAMTALGFDRYFVYGAATGAQFAAELGKLYPDRARFVMLDSNGHISDEMATRLIDNGYFADVTPRRDGGHLLTYWDMCRQLFFSFPWNSDDPAERLGLDLAPADMTHAIFLRYLLAGKDYAKAYKAALHSEKRAHLDGLNVPSIMTRWEGSPVKNIADDLINMGLPECITVHYAGAGLDARYGVQADALKQQIATQALPSTNAGSLVKPDPSTDLRRTYLCTDFGQLHAYRLGGGSQPPLVLLHAAGQSGEQMLGQAAGLAKDRPVWVIDLPHHGGSFDLPEGGTISLDTLATYIQLGLKSAGIDHADFTGRGLGGAIAGKISGNTATAAVPPAHHEDLPDLAPQDDGTHLIRAWSTCRDMAIFHPFWDHRVAAQRDTPLDLSPAILHAKTADMLRVGARWREFMQLELAEAGLSGIA